MTPHNILVPTDNTTNILDVYIHWPVMNNEEKSLQVAKEKHKALCGQ
jgi:hypothetical protein